MDIISDSPTQSYAGAKSAVDELVSSLGQCRICLSKNVAVRCVANGYPIARCRNCTHQMAIVNTGESLDECYGETYYNQRGQQNAIGYNQYLANVDERLKTFHEYLHEIESFAPDKGRLLDVGCAVGLAVKAANDRDWQACGIDRSRWAVEFGRKEFCLDLYDADVVATTGALFDGAFAVVTLWDTIEHVADPRATLTNICNWLRPGGILALNTVDAGSLGARLAGRAWRHYCPPVHLQFFTCRSLYTLLSEFGFIVLCTRAKGVLLDSTSSDWRRSKRAINRVVNHWRLSRLVTRLRLRDEVYIIASRAASTV